MKKRPMPGITVSGETKIQNSAKRGNNGQLLRILRCFCFFLYLAGLLIMAEEAFDLSIQRDRLFVYVGISCMVLEVAEIGGGCFRICSYGWNLFLFVWGAFCWRRVAAGYLIVENGVRRQLSAYYGINLALRQVSGSADADELFLFLVLSLLAAVLGHLVVAKGRVAMAGLIALLFLALELLCGCRFLEIGPYLTVGSLYVLFAMGYRGGVHNQRILYRTGLWAAAILLLLGLLTGKVLGPAIYLRTEKVNQQLYNAVQQTMGQFSAVVHSQNGLFGNHAPTADGSLNNFQVKQDNETNLVVTLEEEPASSVYFRGFIGDTYEGNYWHRIEDADFQQVFSGTDSAYHVQNFLYEYVDSLAALTDSHEKSVQIERVHPGGEYGYVPYGFETPNDENLHSDGTYASADASSRYLGYVNWSQWISQEQGYLENEELERQYRTYVADQYLKVPVEGLDRLKTFCSGQNIHSVPDAIAFVTESLMDGRTYSMDLDPLPSGKDFAEYFFFDQKKGYCIHFATTAALMLRLLGVPARYVTGYVAPADSFHLEETGYVAEVPGTQAHAWVEIYYGEIGWVPLEVTPGFGTGLAGGEEHQDFAEETPVVTEEEPPSPTPESETPQPEESEQETVSLEEEEEGEEQSGSDGGWGQGMLAFLKGVLAVLLSLFLVAAGIQFNRRRILKKRRRRFLQKNVNQGIREISFGLYQMLQDAGITVSFDRDIAYAQKMEEQLEWMEKGTFVRFIRIVEEASYGGKALSRETRRECLAFYHAAAAHLWKTMGETKKFWWKYMKCYEIS